MELDPSLDTLTWNLKTVMCVLGLFVMTKDVRKKTGNSINGRIRLTWGAQYPLPPSAQPFMSQFEVVGFFSLKRAH